MIPILVLKAWPRGLVANSYDAGAVPLNMNGGYNGAASDLDAHQVGAEFPTMVHERITARQSNKIDRA